MTSSEDLSGRTGRIDPATAAQAFGPEGEAALVTGGGSGLGLGMARAFVAAGWIDSAMMQQAMQGNPARRQRVPHRTPLGRFGEAADIGWAAVHLRSPAARFVTGVVLPVDGGVSIGF